MIKEMMGKIANMAASPTMKTEKKQRIVGGGYWALEDTKYGSKLVKAVQIAGTNTYQDDTMRNPQKRRGRRAIKLLQQAA